MSKTPRQIVTVSTVRGDADDIVAHWKALGRKPKLHKRSVRAEGLGIEVYVVVVDISDRSMGKTASGL